MKKYRILVSSLILLLSLTACASQPSPSAEESPPPSDNDCAHVISGGICLNCGEDMGFWRVFNILNENGEETGEWAISSLDRVIGTYSNETVSEGMLEAQLWYDCHGVFSICLWEEGTTLVQPTTGHDCYTIDVRTEAYTSFGPEGWMYDGCDQIIVEAYRKMDFVQALCDGEKVTFLIQNQDEPDRTYAFTVATSNFQSLYEENVGMV